MLRRPGQNALRVASACWRSNRTQAATGKFCSSNSTDASSPASDRRHAARTCPSFAARAAHRRAIFAVVLVPVRPGRPRSTRRSAADPALRQTKLIAVRRSMNGPTQPSSCRQALQRSCSRPVDAIASDRRHRVGDAVRAMPRSSGRPGEPGDGAAVAQGLHLLVAEDNEMNQFVTQQTLLRGAVHLRHRRRRALAVEAVAR